MQASPIPLGLRRLVGRAHGRRTRWVVAVVVLATVHLGWIAWFVATSPPERRVQFMPDDAFYYLTLARNFATQHAWTFDSGVSLTTGFHPLHAYVLAALYALGDPSVAEFVRWSVLLSFLAVVPAILAGGAFARRTGSVYASLLLLALASSRNVSLNVVSGMEWSWVVSIAALYVLALERWRTRPGSGSLAGVFALGAAGSLARTDFGLFPAALAAVALVSPHWFSSTEGRRRAAGACVGLAGATTGLCTVFVHNFFVTGHMVQSSARIKSLRLQMGGPDVGHVITQVLSIFKGSLAPEILSLVLYVVVVALGVLELGLPWVHRWRRAEKDPGDRSGSKEWLWLGAALTVAGYVLLYGYGALAMQTWHTANVVVPLFLLLALPVIETRSTNLLSVAAPVLIVLLIAAQTRAAVTFGDRPEWPDSLQMYRAGNWLRDAALEGRVGSWNAGILGYYQGGGVVNLDGLMNDGVYEYVVRNALPEYIESRRIRYVLDFEGMVRGKHRRRRGGYDRPDFVRRLEPVRVFPGPVERWGKYCLYEIAPAVGRRQHPLS